MAPPRRATPRRAGSREPRQSTASTAPSQAVSGASEGPDDSSSSRPQVRTRQSFSYGTMKTPLMPPPLEANPSMSVDQMAETIDSGLREANERELPNLGNRAHASREGQIRTRSQTRRAESNASSPAPLTRGVRGKREPTPDDQLMDSLREDSEGSQFSNHREDSTSDSVISWRVEREIHGSRNVNGVFPEQTRGLATLAAQPRRPTKASGLRDMIKEEPEDHEEFDMSSVPASEEVSTNHTEARDAQKTSTAQISAPEDISTTHISQTVEPAAAVPESNHISTSNSSDTSPSIPVAPTLIRSPNLSPLMILSILLTILAVFSTYTFKDKLNQIPHVLNSSPIFSGINSSQVRFNASEPSGHAAAINHLSSQFDKLGERFRDMSRDINDLKDDWSKKLPLINEVISRTQPPPQPQPPRDPLSPPRVNFCSIGLGAVIDPYLTTPTKKKRNVLFQRLNLYSAGVNQKSSPASILQSWDGVGDCWCSSSKTEITQIGVLLGRKIVPEEVVIEHIPKGATLDPGAAPREMELWAEYKTDSGSDAASKFPISLHNTIMDTLREAYPDEPETAYSDDLALEQNFYRIGKWTYDIDAENHIQAFPLNAVIDVPDARVEKVVFRTNTNWGSEHTCLYRVRLHGYL